MKVDHIILCKGSSVDKDSQSLSIFEMIEQMRIQAPQFPVNVPVHAVLIFRREQEEGVLSEPWQMRLVGPDQTTLFSQNIDVKMESHHQRQRLRVNFPIQVKDDGIYTIEMRHLNDETNVRAVSIDVKAITDISQRPQ